MCYLRRQNGAGACRNEADRELSASVVALADRLIVTRAVVEEALRLYPQIAALSRIPVGRDTVGSFEVKFGSLVVIAP